MSIVERMRDRATPSARNLSNRARFGAAGPRFAERIWVSPLDCGERVFGIRRRWSGRVLGGDWDLTREPVERVPKVAAAVARWQEGRSWADTGILEWSLAQIEREGALDGCTSLQDLERRYAQLDDVFARLRRDGRLRTRAELETRPVGELGGVLINIDRDARPVAGGGGWHRLAMARILRLPRIPAQVGVVHPAALPRWREEFDAQR